MTECSEVEDGMKLAMEEARKLHELTPDHELLDLFKKGEDDGVWDSFQERFGKARLSREERQGYLAQGYFWAQYYLALKDACEKAVVPSSV